jgi:hypothetical protein
MGSDMFDFEENEYSYAFEIQVLLGVTAVNLQDREQSRFLVKEVDSKLYLPSRGLHRGLTSETTAKQLFQSIFKVHPNWVLINQVKFIDGDDNKCFLLYATHIPEPMPIHLPNMKWVGVDRLTDDGGRIVMGTTAMHLYGLAARYKNST